jgi:hypothetical protein
MQVDARVFRKQRWPFRLRFLHTIFTEHALAGGDHRLNGIRAESLRHRNQGHFREVTLRIAARPGDFRTNMLEAVCSDSGHALAISHRFVRRHFK